MFRSISDQLYGSTDRHSEVRQKIVNYMNEHEDHFSLFVEDDEPFDEYISRMHTAREWGGHQELFAASCCYKANIFVYQLQTPRWVLPAPDDVSPSDTVTINLSYHGEYHYNSLHRDPAFDPIISNSISTEVINNSSRKEKEKDSVVENERRDMLVQLQSTLPWICPAGAAASLEACDYQYLKAVEHAIEHFFSPEQEQVQKQEKRDSDEDAPQAVNNTSSQSDIPVPPVSTSSKEATESKESTSKKKFTKTKLPPGLSKKEKRLLKKEKHIGAISKPGSEGGSGGMTAVTASVGDIIL
mmetsp:Transcript_17808/g.29760  ORF Transcript_17808/g.29760 Transcript_17808/m.29760 type:complete len:299 (-) Transcript_17808:694-1590(-)